MAGWECVVIVTPVSRCATAAASMIRATSSVIPAASVTTLMMPARIAVPSMPSSMSRRNNSARSSGPSSGRPGPCSWK